MVVVVVLLLLMVVVVIVHLAAVAAAVVCERGRRRRPLAVLGRRVDGSEGRCRGRRVRVVRERRPAVNERGAARVVRRLRPMVVPLIGGLYDQAVVHDPAVLHSPLLQPAAAAGVPDAAAPAGTSALHLP